MNSYVSACSPMLSCCGCTSLHLPIRKMAQLDHFMNLQWFIYWLPSTSAASFHPRLQVLRSSTAADTLGTEASRISPTQMIHHWCVCVFVSMGLKVGHHPSQVILQVYSLTSQCFCLARVMDGWMDGLDWCKQWGGGIHSQCGEWKGDRPVASMNNINIAITPLLYSTVSGFVFPTACISPACSSPVHREERQKYKNQMFTVIQIIN